MGKLKAYTMSFASVYSPYVTKAEKKGRTKTEVDQLIFWLTGYDQESLQTRINGNVDFETFFAQAPGIPPMLPWSPAKSAVTAWRKSKMG